MINWLFQNLKENKLLLFVLVLCLSYWIFLFQKTEMLIVFDSIGYRDVGALIYEKGWIEFFKTGVHREPLYYCLIALSMKIGNVLSISYESVLKGIQILFLFISQLILFNLLSILRIRKTIKLLTVLYFGLSPAINNSALSMFSEIAVVPFVLMGVLFSFELGEAVIVGNAKDIVILSILNAFNFLMVTLGKGLFVYIFYLYCLLLIIFSVVFLFKKNYFKMSLLMFATVFMFVLFAVPVHFYKDMNRKYNGFYKLSSADLSIFLGSTYKRTEALNPRKLAAYLASVPGTGVCNLFFTKEECDYCDWYGSDAHRTKFLTWAYANIPAGQIDALTLKMSLGKIAQHPFRYFFLTSIEIFKMPFWESTQIGYVEYPRFMQSFYDWKPFRYGIRLGVALITIISFFFIACFVFRKRKEVLNRSADARIERMLFLILLILSAFSGIYASCYVIPRYALPIASLYLLLIASSLEIFCHMKIGQRMISFLKGEGFYFLLVIICYVTWRARIFLER